MRKYRSYGWNWFTLRCRKTFQFHNIKNQSWPSLLNISIFIPISVDFRFSRILSLSVWKLPNVCRITSLVPTWKIIVWLQHGKCLGSRMSQPWLVVLGYSTIYFVCACDFRWAPSWTRVLWWLCLEVYLFKYIPVYTIYTYNCYLC